VAWKQTLAAFLLLLVTCWVTLAGAAYWFVRYKRNFPDVRFSHMLFYPTQKTAYREQRGNYLVDNAKKNLSAQKYREAFENLNYGLSLAPRNRDGRILLAQFFVAWQRPDRAETLLIEGLSYHEQDNEYLKSLFNFLLQRQSDYTLIDLTNSLLEKLGANPPIDERLRLIVISQATAKFYRGNYDAAEDLIKKYGVSNSPDGQLLSIRIDWDRGERETALVKLEAISEQFPENEALYAQYASYLREIGRDSELRRLALLRQFSYPDRTRPRVDLLYLYDKTKDTVNVNAGIEEILTDFNSNSDTLLALADFAANTGRPDLARRIYDHCKAHLLPWEGAALMTVEAHVVAKQYRQALETAQNLIKENPEWGKRFYSVFNGLQAIANYGLQDEEAANLFLSNFLNHSGVRAENLVAVSNRLVSVGANRQARQVLAQAIRADPLNQTALVGLIKLDLSAGNTDSVANHIQTLMTMRKPPRSLLQDAYAKLSSDRYLYAPGRASLLDELKRNIQAQIAQRI
jgi:thioredoxin-like negative regulator of GroEL